MTQDATRDANLQFRVPSDLKKRFRIACIEDGVEMTEVIIQAMQEYLDRRQQQPSEPK